MNEQRIDDYLWHRAGEADPLIDTLESLLARYRHDGQPPPPNEDRADDAGESTSDVQQR